LPAGMNEQVPRLLLRLQTLHTSLQSVSQQTPSAQCPLPQSVNLPQACPFWLLHCWLASQALPAPQESSGVPGGTFAHVPPMTPPMPGTLQAWQVPGQEACAQQTPSTQLLDMQLVPSEQAWPFGRSPVLALYAQISCGP